MSDFDGEGLRNMLEQADDLLTDSNHPLDMKQTAKVSLMLIQQIVNMQLSIRREIAVIRVDLQAQRARLDDRIFAVEGDVADIKRTMADYPSILWLLRYRTKATVMWIGGTMVVLIGLFLSYQEWLLARLGLPPFLP